MRSRDDAPASCRVDSRGVPPASVLSTLALAVLTLSHEAGAGLTATADPVLVANLDRPVFVDTRTLEACARGSIDGTLCMAPSQLVHPDGSPASFRDLNWLAGTFDLDPTATAVVFGHDDTDNDFVAGMLFLLGQSRVVIWRGEVRSMLEAGEPGAGRRRGILRSRYFSSPVRDGYIALDSDARRFFGAGTASGVDFSTRDTDASLYRRDDDGSLLVLADRTREAVAGLSRLLLEHPPAPVQVHIDGLRGRTAESLGAPGEGIPRMMPVAVALGIVLALCIALVARRRATARDR